MWLSMCFKWKQENIAFELWTMKLGLEMIGQATCCWGGRAVFQPQIWTILDDKAEMSLLHLLPLAGGAGMNPSVGPECHLWVVAPQLCVCLRGCMAQWTGFVILMEGLQHLSLQNTQANGCAHFPPNTLPQHLLVPRLLLHLREGQPRS